MMQTTFPSRILRPPAESLIELRESESAVLSASLNRRSENVVVKAVIIAELELSDIEVKVLFADVVEGANDAAFEDAPEAFNGLRMDSADDILVFGVIDGAVRECKTKVPVANPLIGADQAYLVGHGLVDESLQGGLFHVLDDAGDDVSLAPDSADDDGLAGGSRPRLSVAFVPMPVLCLAADKGLVDLHNAAEFGFGLNQGGADFVSHQPSSFDRTETHVAAKLARAHSLFAGQDQVSDFEPVAQWLVGVLENGPCDAREAVAVLRAGFALPVKAGRQFIDLDVAATRAIHTIRPAASNEVGLAGILVIDREHGVELRGRKLMHGLGALDLGHGVSSSVGGYCHAG